MTTLAGGASISVTLAAGNTLRVQGTGIATVNNQQYPLPGSTTLGPWPAQTVVELYSETPLPLYYYTILPTGNMVYTASTPDANDGMPPGTLYISAAGIFSKAADGSVASIGGGGSSGSVSAITGGLTVGSTITAVPATGWAFASGQWYRDGAAISGQTGLTYTRVQADVGTVLSFVPTSPVYSAVASSTVGPTQPLRAAALNTIAYARGGIGGTTRQLSVSPYTLGSGDLSELVLSVYGWYGTGNNMDNAYTVENVFLENPGRTQSVRITFPGGNSQVVNPGDTDLKSNPIYPSQFGLSKFTRGERWFVRVELSVATAGLQWPYADGRSTTYLTNTQYVYYDPAATTVTNGASGTGAFTATGTAFQSNAVGYGAFMLGRFISGDPMTVFQLGDSGFQGQGDNIATSIGHGMATRSLYQPTTFASPFAGFCMAIFGITTVPMGNSKIIGYAKYCNLALTGLGANDIGTTAGSGTTAATTYAQNKTNWNLIKAQGISKVITEKPRPRTTSTDNWATSANQTIKPNWGSGEVADQYRVLLDSAVANGDVSFVVDHLSVRESGNYYKWIANGTANYMSVDGDHTSQVGHELNAVDFRNGYSQFTFN